MKFIENSTAQALAGLFWMIAGCDTNAEPTADPTSAMPEMNGEEEACGGIGRYSYDDCDGVDNDCDGLVDENEPTVAVCEEPSCTTGQPFCENGIWRECGALPELCNGMDDNCDRVIDEGCPCEGAPEGDLRDCGSPWIGECMPGVQLCLHGQWTECIGGIWPKEETCDGLDNDCDEEIDEDWPLLGMPCDGDDGDFCEEGTYVCQINPGGLGSVVCSEDFSDSAEVCNGFDDDCDGVVDEGLLNACGTCGATPPEVCDGIDNDCNGVADEGANRCGGVCALTRIPGVSCDGSDADLCMEGVWTCAGLNTVTCDDATDDSIESCNGLDDDCDGTIDEGSNGCGGACALAGTPGISCDGPDSDFCAEGVWICVDSNTVSCDDATGDPTETCNGLDDDCDGVIDEDLTQSCGSESCAGVTICSGGVWSACSSAGADCGVCCLCTSSTNPVPGYDSTQDGDCSPTACPSSGCDGVCGINRYMNYPSTRENHCAALHACTNYACNPTCEGDGDGDGYSPSCGDCDNANRYARPGLFELCDQIDNNCDGTVDEGCGASLTVLDAPFVPASGAVRGVFDTSVSNSGRAGLGSVDVSSGLRHHLIKFYWNLDSGERVTTGEPAISSFASEVWSSDRMPVLDLRVNAFADNATGLSAAAQERAREFAYWLRDTYSGEMAVELFSEMNLNPSPYCPGGWNASTCIAVFRRAFQFVSNLLLLAAPGKAHVGIGYNMRWFSGSGGGPGTHYADWSVDRAYYSWVGYHIFAHACISGGARETTDPWFLKGALTEPGNDFQATFCADAPCLIAETGASDQCSAGYQNWWIDRFAIGADDSLPYFNMHLPDIRGYIWFHQNNAALGGWEEDWRVADFGHYRAIFGDSYFRDAP